MAASAPGFMYNFPWESWGNFKYLLYAPLAARALYKGVIQGYSLAENLCFHMLVLVALRYLLFQAWGTVSRLPYFSRKYQIQTKGIKFEQIDHEASWENMLISTSNIIWVTVEIVLPPKGRLRAWDPWGLPIAFLVHIGPVEWLYYWAHRVLHHHFLFTRYHQHHHSSFVTQPITSSNHPFIELMLYHVLFSLPLFATLRLGHLSFGIIHLYTLFVDFMNAWGHCNFEFIPVWVFETFWPLKYIIYSPTFHSLHHTKVHTNFCLFMPLYDYLYDTVDATFDSLHEDVRQRGHEMNVDCVYLTHATDLLSTFHLQFGFQTFAAQPFAKKWYMWLMWPVAFVLMLLAWVFAKPFVGATHFLGNKLELQTWVIPRFSFQYHLSMEAKRINGWIEKCIVEAQQAGAKVIALGLLNKDHTLHIDKVLMYKEDTRISIVTGDTLAAAIVAKKVDAQHNGNERKAFITSAHSRVGRAIAKYLCKHGFRVLALIPSKAEHVEDPRLCKSAEFHDNFVYVQDYAAGKSCKVWLIGEEIGREAQKLAPKGTHFYQFGVFPIHKYRKDCSYSTVPGLKLPKDAQNINACEDVLPRYVVRTGYAAAMLHVLAGLQYHDYEGDISMELMSQSWELAIKHGFSIVY